MQHKFNKKKCRSRAKGEHNFINLMNLSISQMTPNIEVIQRHALNVNGIVIKIKINICIPVMFTCSITSFNGVPTFCNTVSSNENSGADCAGSVIVDAADVTVSGVLVLSFLLFCSFSPIWPFGRTRNRFVKTTWNLQWKKKDKKNFKNKTEKKLEEKPRITNTMPVLYTYKFGIWFMYNVSWIQKKKQ